MGVTFRIGCAGWSLSHVSRDSFPPEGSHLERYAARLPAAEINSSFYRPHRRDTWVRWAESVPPDFRFFVKIPKAITHVAKLVDAGAAFDEFLPGPLAMGARLGGLLVQLAPSLAWDAAVAEAFFAALRARYDGAVALEPRHASWFEEPAARALEAHRIARVAADPARVPAAAEPGGWPALVYFRLHGSPRMYYSSYDDAWLDALADRLRAAAAVAAEAWCIFDNTAHGAAALNALGLRQRLDALPTGAAPACGARS